MIAKARKEVFNIKTEATGFERIAYSVKTIISNGLPVS